MFFSNKSHITNYKFLIMKVLKFGGTSVGSVKNLYKIKGILNKDTSQKIIVCSAMSGVTDELIKLAESIKNRDLDAASRFLYFLKQKHFEVIECLITSPEKQGILKDYVETVFTDIFELYEEDFSESVNSQIITSGEFLLTRIFSEFLNLEGVKNTWLDAKDFMHVDAVENPNIDRVSERIKCVLADKEASKLFITQGFICKTSTNEISHLKRGGSDYSATIIAAAIEANEVQIWTDIDGLHNNDPRYVSNTHPISHITYKEASELAYFGAKILHPQTARPVREKQIPVWVKNTFEPEAFGTLISDHTLQRGLKAISAKDGITTINIKSNRLLMPHGYFKRIFDIFDKYETSIDMITTSEVEISLTIDSEQHLDTIVDELKKFSNVVVNPSSSIICIVGESVIEDKSCSKIFDLLNYIPLRMISYGGSNNSISILIDTKDKINALQFLNDKLFNTYPEKYVV